MNHRRRFLAHVGIAGLTGMGGIHTAERNAPALISASSRFRRFEGDDNKEPTADELKATIASLTRDRDKYKGDFERVDTEHKTAAQRLKEIDDKGKTDLQKLADEKKSAEDRLTVAEARAHDTALRLSVEREARKAGFLDEDDAARLIDTKAVKFDADGNPTNVSDLLADLAKAKPHLVKTADTATARTGNSSNPNRSRAANATRFTESQLRDPKFYNENRAAILLALREGRIDKG